MYIPTSVTIIEITVTAIEITYSMAYPLSEAAQNAENTAFNARVYYIRTLRQSQTAFN
jgi:hypothetical protein